MINSKYGIKQLLMSVLFLPMFFSSCLTVRDIVGDGPIRFYPYLKDDPARVTQAVPDQTGHWFVSVNELDAILVNSSGEAVEPVTIRIDGNSAVWEIEQLPADGYLEVENPESEISTGIILQPSIPDSVRNLIIYHVYLGYFFNGDPSNDNVYLSAKGEFYNGGDIEGLLEKTDYLFGLGVNCIYLSPLFLSGSTHGYNVDNYYYVSDALGVSGDQEASRDLLRSFIDKCHNRGIKVILDIPLNHGSTHYDFDLGNPNGYNIKQTGPQQVGEYFFDSNHGKIYDYWDFDDAETRAFLTDVMKYWVGEYCVDGFRLDYATGVPPDYWLELHHELKKLNPDLFFLGEIWSIPTDGLDMMGGWFDISPDDDEPFDTMFDFPFRHALVKVFTSFRSAELLESVLQQETAAFPYGSAPMYIVENADLNRFAVLCGSKKTLLNAFTFVNTLSGHTFVLYGTETGMDERKIYTGLGPSMHSRHPFPWNDMDDKLIDEFRTVIRVRSEHSSLTRGGRLPVYCDRYCLVMLKTDRDETALIGLNTGKLDRVVTLDNKMLADMLQDGELVLGSSYPELQPGLEGRIHWLLPADTTTVLIMEPLLAE